MMEMKYTSGGVEWVGYRTKRLSQLKSYSFLETQTQGNERSAVARCSLYTPIQRPASLVSQRAIQLDQPGQQV
jgi:hypothetical protein